MGLQRGAAPVVLHGNCRHRAGHLLPQHTRGAGAVISGERNTDADSRLQYIKTRITSTGGYDSFNMPFFNVTEYGDSTRTGQRFLYDGHTSSNLNIGMNLTELPPSTNWGHWHANMVGSG